MWSVLKQEKGFEFLRGVQRPWRRSCQTLTAALLGGLLWSLQAQARPLEVPAHLVDVREHHADWLVPGVAHAACWLHPEVVQALGQAQAVLAPLGMALRLQSCWEPGVAGHSQGLAVDVALWVTDAEKATAVLRSPLAEDEPVDMGTAHAQPDPGRDDPLDSLSPDAQEHRRWLRDVLAHQGLQGGTVWWHFERATSLQGVAQKLHPSGGARPGTSLTAGLCGHLPAQGAGIAAQHTLGLEIQGLPVP